MFDGKLNGLTKSIHKTNVEKGFYDRDFNLGEKLMLVVSELGEALEADRSDNYCRKGMAKSILDDYRRGEIEFDEDFKSEFKGFVKDRFEDELADAIIRLLDLCGKMDIDIESHIFAKLKYNSLRKYKHGKAY